MDDVGLTNQSIWTATATTPDYPSLTESITADVCVVGAGIAGLSIAYELIRAGRKVVVLEKGTVGGGMTSMTTAHLTCAVDDRYFVLEGMHGRDVTCLVAQAHTAALDHIESIVQAEGIACDFARVDGVLTLGAGDDVDLLERELQAAHSAGLGNVSLEQREVYPARGLEPCLVFPRQGRFHPLLYLRGLAEAITRGGGRIFCHSHVHDVVGGLPVRVSTADHAVSASAAIIATNAPITERLTIHTKQAPYMTYVIAAPFEAGSVADALRWDTEDPYHYVRLQRVLTGDNTREYLIVGGEDHKTGQAADGDARFAKIAQWARERFLTIGDIDYRWSGEIMESVDRLAFIGASPSEDEGVYIVTGESGVGMTHCTIAASIITDAILGRANRWAELYDPRRRTYAAAANYLKENLNVAAQYLAWLTPGEVASSEEIPAGSGAVMRRGPHKIAVYRDESGVLHERSAACSHLGCIVRWNTTERTWDCPCHGSRFDPYGAVVSGPAAEALSAAPGS